MVRASKQSTPSATVADVTVATEPKKVAAKKSSSKTVETPVVAPAKELVLDAPANEVVAVVGDDLVELLNAFSIKITEVASFHANLKAQFKVLQ